MSKISHLTQSGVMVHASTQRTALFIVALITSAGTAPAPPPAPARSDSPVTNLTGNWRLFLNDVHISHTSGDVSRSFHSFARAPAPFLSLAANENLALGASGVFPYHSVLPPDPSPSCSPSGACAQWRLWYDCWRDVWGVRTFLTPAPILPVGLGRESLFTMLGMRSDSCHRPNRAGVGGGLCVAAFTVRVAFRSWRVSEPVLIISRPKTSSGSRFSFGAVARFATRPAATARRGIGPRSTSSSGPARAPTSPSLGTWCSQGEATLECMARSRRAGAAPQPP